LAHLGAGALPSASGTPASIAAAVVIRNRTETQQAGFADSPRAAHIAVALAVIAKSTSMMPRSEASSMS